MQNSEIELVEEMSYEQYRQKLAGISINSANQARYAQSLRDLAIRFAAALPEVFGEELDRLTLWDRIASGLTAAVAKATNYDYEMFVQLVLQHIKADPSKASRNEKIVETLRELEVLSESERREWIDIYSTRMIPILVHARKMWHTTKTENAAK